MPLLGLLSRLVSAPPEKPQLAQNEAHTAPQQRYGSFIVRTWPLRTGNTLALPPSTNQWEILTQDAPPRFPLSPRERTTSEATAGPKRSTPGPAAALRSATRLATHRLCTARLAGARIAAACPGAARLAAACPATSRPTTVWPASASPAATRLTAARLGPGCPASARPAAFCPGAVHPGAALPAACRTTACRWSPPRGCPVGASAAL